MTSPIPVPPIQGEHMPENTDVDVTDEAERAVDLWEAAAVADIQPAGEPSFTGNVLIQLLDEDGNLKDERRSGGS